MSYLIDGGQVVWVLAGEEGVSPSTDKVVEGHERTVKVLDTKLKHHVMQLRKACQQGLQVSGLNTSGQWSEPNSEHQAHEVPIG